MMLSNDMECVRIFCFFICLLSFFSVDESHTQQIGNAPEMLPGIDKSAEMLGICQS